MSDQIESLEKMVQKPKKAKKPSNAALWFAYVFFNIVILTFDTVAAGTVYAITNNWGYTILTFLSGFMPLMLHEFLFLRAYASPWQRYLAVFGAISAVLTVAAVALLSAGVNLALAGGYQIASGVSEIAILIVIVGSALLHGVLAAVYFYIDEGIRATHTEAETVAYFEQRMKNIKRAETLLDEANTARNKKAEIVKKHGGNDGKAALDYLLNLLNDDDGDGIPNAFDRVDNRQQNAPRATQPRQDESRTDIQSEPKPQTNFTLQDYLTKAGTTKEQAIVKFGGLRYEDFAKDCNERFDHISSGNMKKIWHEELKAGNPTPAAVTGRNS